MKDVQIRFLPNGSSGLGSNRLGVPARVSSYPDQSRAVARYPPARNPNPGRVSGAARVLKPEVSKHNITTPVDTSAQLLRATQWCLAKLLGYAYLLVFRQNIL